MKEFKTNLKNYRVSKGYTQEALAKQLFVSRSAVAKWENGLGLPSEESIIDICNLFEITKDELFETEDTNKLILEKNKKISKYKNYKNIAFVGLSILIIAFMVFLIIHSEKVEPIYYQNESNIEVKLHDGIVVLEDNLCIDEEDGYVYNRIEIHPLNFTTNSKLYAIVVDTTFTPGIIAAGISETGGYNKNSRLGYGKVIIDTNNSTMDYQYSYPQNSDDIHFLTPSFGGDIIIGETQFCGINLYSIDENTCKLEYIKSEDGFYSPRSSTLMVNDQEIVHTQIPQDKHSGLSMMMRTVYFFERKNVENIGDDIAFSITYEMNVDNRYYMKKINYNCNYQ